MPLLTGYFDETGDTRDPAQRFAGMAGFVAPDEKWEGFERKWKFILKEFKLPYFHMKEFNPSEGIFKEWKGDEVKRQRLFGSLLRTIQEIKPLPVGCVFSAEDFRSLTERERNMIRDPYFFSFISCVGIPSMLIQNAPSDVQLALIFGEHGVFASTAKKFYAQMQKLYQVGSRLHAPEFRDMKDCVQLQAADLIAYELYKEADRQRYRADMVSRFGIRQIVDMAKLVTNANTLLLPRDGDLRWMIEEAKRIRGAILTGAPLGTSPIRMRLD